MTCQNIYSFLYLAHAQSHAGLSSRTVKIGDFRFIFQNIGNPKYPHHLSSLNAFLFLRNLHTKFHKIWLAESESIELFASLISKLGYLSSVLLGFGSMESQWPQCFGSPFSKSKDHHGPFRQKPTGPRAVPTKNNAF